MLRRTACPSGTLSLFQKVMSGFAQYIERVMRLKPRTMVEQKGGHHSVTGHGWNSWNMNPLKLPGFQGSYPTTFLKVDHAKISKQPITSEEQAQQIQDRLRNSTLMVSSQMTIPLFPTGMVLPRSLLLMNLCAKALRSYSPHD